MTPVSWGLLAMLILSTMAFTLHGIRARRSAILNESTVRHLVQQLDAETTSASAQSEEWYAAGAALQEALLFVDSDLNVYYANPQARTVFGGLAETGASLITYTQSEELERFCRDAFSVPNDDEPLEYQTEMQNSIFRVRALAFNGGAAVTLTDISRLQRLDKARRELVANISHELRTPLTAIRLLLEMLQSRKHPSSTRIALQKIMTETDTLQQMAQELLDVSRIESGQAAVKLVSTDISQVMESLVERMHPQAKRKEVEINTDILPNTPVLADAEQIQRALANILHNAIKFTQPGGTVNIHATADSEHFCIDVRDTGPGISPQDLPRIFERFFRGDPARHGAGTGLGMAIAKHVVQAHGGEISIKNRPGGGTKVSLTLLRADIT